MLIIGVDYHPSVQQIAWVDTETGETEERRLKHSDGEAGAITALAFVLVMGTPQRFGCGKQVASYLGLVPSEDSSADRRRLGHISKQGNTLVRHLLGQAAQSVANSDEEWRRQYAQLAMRRNRSIAKVAMARKLAVRLYWMWRQGYDYQQWTSSVRTRGKLELLHGMK